MKVKITVLKKEFYKDYAEEYLTSGALAGSCSELEIGAEFIYEGGAKMPNNFCPYAWQDIYSSVSVLSGSKDIDNTWYKNSKTKIICCTDGIRPVVFKLEQFIE
ncbi:TIGR04076 family protein [Clostridium tertium]|jgi:uncharacterized repeat protein (TIGR04076 family)|uniref:TIGR04076 family protein n=1 Tax=Clostridium TaxID=1485 RepID=UPI001159153E|nr:MULTISPECIES: TIGR04076 family protein [Clostridium]MBS5305396.1 TIGR04076 family protein [Clostridium sp.]MDB1923420.1 TIGR04076 family protein [Clostridium tertium]MDB1927852.1 TIGR04076 family protein [Clostridium tertium]MDB1931476.1 TIGR04076 family protein [Clostridium tertium]MDB1942599.1 TIGR04076 family protein [Clostridium tertium]